MLTKPPHTDTIELTVEQLEQGAREERYSQQLREWREGSMKTGQWVELLQDEKFMQWAKEL